jgi:hypothetical protein
MKHGSRHADFVRLGKRRNKGTEPTSKLGAFFRRTHVVIPGTIKLFNIVYEHKVWAVVSVFHAAGILAGADGVDASAVGQGNSSLLPCFSALISKDLLYDLVVFDLMFDRIEVLNRSLDCRADDNSVVKCLN